MTVATPADRERGPAGGRSPARVPCEAHGRALSTTADAARSYRRAQAAAPRPEDDLRRALLGDPFFAVARADLAALTDSPLAHLDTAALHPWERRHVEIVTAARTGHVHRAADLLRDHLADVGCDPLALAAVRRRAQSRPCCVDLDDLVESSPDCHAEVSR